jgi:3-oxoacyl-[acyl-carrier protein] reductase
MLLADKVALVTGGSRGIGRGICLALAEQGAKVAVVYARNTEAADEVVKQIANGNGQAMAIQCDVRHLDEAAAAVDKVIEDWGQLDILVNNAGVVRDTLLSMDRDAWDQVVDTNLGGAYNFCKAAARPMVSQRKGRIINISSVAAAFGGRGQVNYAASKGGINSFTRSLAGELASRTITVNAVAPGMIETEMSEQIRQMAGDKISSLIPLKRYGQPEDIAQTVLFLASDASEYITGQVITVDGGLSLGAKW